MEKKSKKSKRKELFEKFKQNRDKINEMIEFIYAKEFYDSNKK